MPREPVFLSENLHQSGEDYLEAILVLHSRKGDVRSIDIADYLQYSKPSVCRAVSVLRKAGCLTIDKNHFIYLTDIGRAIAEEIYDRHCFFTDFFIKIGIDPIVAEEDACLIEHNLSEETYEHVRMFLKDYMQNK